MAKNKPVLNPDPGTSASTRRPGPVARLPRGRFPPLPAGRYMYWDVTSQRYLDCTPGDVNPDGTYHVEIDADDHDIPSSRCASVPFIQTKGDASHATHFTVEAEA